MPIRSRSVGTFHPHPRLIFSASEWERLTRPAGSPIVTAAAQRVAQLADACLGSTTFEYPANTHNAHLIRARIMQGRILTLLVQWRLTGAERYRRAAVAHVRQMGRWRYWSWIAWRARDARPEATFDLSYGENAATLALAWDALHDALSPIERRDFLAIARRWPFKAFFNNGRGTPTYWWMTKTDSNWLAVCAGGMGMLSLAMREEVPESRRALGYVERAMKAYMATLEETGGGWTEGVGYWGYGMRYAFWYLLSWEHAMGREHPLLRLRGAARTVDFPLDFTPNGVPCSFGDVNHFGLHPIQYALAERFRRPDILPRVDAFARTAQGAPPRLSGWPVDAELLLLHPRRMVRPPKPRRNVLRHYPGMDWFFLADRWPEPGFYVSIRGGTTEVPHGHLDLMSFHAVVGREGLIRNLIGSEYLDTTFSPRRYELPEMTPACKNSLLVNGVGIAKPASVASRILHLNGCAAIRLDATSAMGASRSAKPFRFCGRLFVWLDGRGLAILDVVDQVHFGRAECRFHTLGHIRTAGESRALLVGKREALSLAFAATVPCEVRRAAPAMTSPGQDPLTIRWCTRGLHQRMALATLLVPGRNPGRLSLEESRAGLLIRAAIGGRTWRFPLSWRLQDAG